MLLAGMRHVSTSNLQRTWDELATGIIGSVSSPEVVRDDIEVITGIAERFLSWLVSCSVAWNTLCLTIAGL